MGARRSWPLQLAGLLAVVAATAAHAQTQPPTAAPEVPASSGEWRGANPYRGRADAIEAGALAYGRHCAACHGEGATAFSPEGPDLRRLDSFCRRLADAPLREHCLSDVDAYFMHSVREGKWRAGLIHMPAWKGVLPPETIWAIRTFIETRPRSPPRLLPDLPTPD